MKKVKVLLQNRKNSLKKGNHDLEIEMASDFIIVVSKKDFCLIQIE